VFLVGRAVFVMDQKPRFEQNLQCRDSIFDTMESPLADVDLGPL
jgi:hypothetical protein